MMDENGIIALIGRNIAQYRRRAGFTQEQLAEQVGVTPAFISRVECGKKSMKISTLIAVAQALQVSVDALVSEPSNDAVLANIHKLLAGVPDAYLESVEAIARLCIERFEPKKPSSK